MCQIKAMMMEVFFSFAYVVHTFVGCGQKIVTNTFDFMSTSYKAKRPCGHVNVTLCENMRWIYIYIFCKRVFFSVYTPDRSKCVSVRLLFFSVFQFGISSVNMLVGFMHCTSTVDTKSTRETCLSGVVHKLLTHVLIDKLIWRETKTRNWVTATMTMGCIRKYLTNCNNLEKTMIFVCNQNTDVYDSIHIYGFLFISSAHRKKNKLIRREQEKPNSQLSNKKVRENTNILNSYFHTVFLSIQ